ncbi:MAG: cation-translocating P-type ATPase [Bacillota bacterium]
MKANKASKAASGAIVEGDSIRARTPEYHSLEVSDVAGILGTDISTGLSSEEARARFERFGPNELLEKPGPTILQMFVGQFKEPLVLVLIIAAVISAALREVGEGLVIMAIVVLNAVLGVTQESKAEKSLAALKKLAAPLARVRRDGMTVTVPTRELVPGDVVLIEAGDHIPADIRIAEAITLKVEEAALTGESVPVEKSVERIPQQDVSLGDRTNMLHMATICVYGRGRGVVVATGMNTQVGRIAGLMEASLEKQTPLQERMEDLGKWLGGAALGLCGLMFLAGLLRGIQVFEMFLTAVSLAVAAIPEGLPAIVTVVLAIGVQRMARHRAIIRKLPAVETLGSATAICSDKTGTLTENEMTVVRAYVNRTVLEVTGQGYSPQGEFRIASAAVLDCSEPHLCMLARIAALCNNAELRQNPDSGEWYVIGDPTEGALVVASRKAGFGPEEARGAPRVAEIPFDSVRKRMTTINRFPWPLAVEAAGANVAGPGGALTEDGGSKGFGAQPGSDGPSFAEQPSVAGDMDSPEGATGATRATGSPGEPGTYVALVKGAPDSVLRQCAFIFEAGEVRPLDEGKRAEITRVNASMAAEALRVLACAYRSLGVAGMPSRVTAEEIERDLVFVGLMGMMDPPRAEVPAAVQTCRGAGILPIMITGDHKDTAVAIAQAVGLGSSDGVEPCRADALSKARARWQAGDGDGERVTTALSGNELDSLTDEELDSVVGKISVYARVSPEHKVRIVEALQRQGHVVAMTGDGVNDAPALKRADIGCAMGITGTDVAKEAADMVLADDNFATIVEAVRQGRAIFDNIRRSIAYLISCNIGEIVAIFTAVVTGSFRPLTPIQILWVNLVTDSLPALALGVEPPEPGIMRRPPRKRQESVFGRGGGLRIGLYGAFIGGVTLLAFWLGVREEIGTARDPVLAARTMAFATMSLSQLFHAFNFRSTIRSLFQVGPLTNKYLVGAWIASGLLQLAVLTVPALRPVFDTVPLTGPEWATVCALSLSPLIFGELLKAAMRRGTGLST